MLPIVEIASLVAGQREQNLGNSVVVYPEDRSPKTVLQLDGQMPSAGELLTVFLASSRASFDGPPELGVPNAIAKFEYGQGGDRSGELEADWDHGTLVTLPANSLRVSASYPPILGIDSIRCSAFIVRGTRPAGAGPRRTLVSEEANTAAVAIPVGAKRLTVWDVLTPTAVQFLDHAGAVIGFFVALATGSPAPGAVSVPPSARQVEIIGPHLARLVFDLEG